MDKVLSISVASYNLGDLIRENLSSFCDSEIIDKIEVLVTDDGSKDNTPDIVQEYVEKFPESIKLIRKENGGPGSTVNSGIKNATGKYFRMVDGDDWVKTEKLKDFVEFLEFSQADMIISDYYMYDESCKKFTMHVTSDLTPGKNFSIDEVYGRLPLDMHAIAYKTSLYKENDLKLDNGFYTDVEYVLLPIKYVKTVSYFNGDVYMYRVGQANQSMNPEKMVKNFSQHDGVFMRMLEMFNRDYNGYSEGQKQFIARRLGTMASNEIGILLLFETNKENKERIIKLCRFIKGQKDLFRYFKRDKKYKILAYSKFTLYNFLAKKLQQRHGVEYV